MVGDIITCECTCHLTAEKGDFFYDDEAKARWMFDRLAPVERKDGKAYRARQKGHWSVHLGGKHIVNIVYQK